MNAGKWRMPVFDAFGPQLNTSMSVEILVLNGLEPRQNYKSLEHERANISSPNCNKLLIFGKYAFFIVYFQKISLNPITSKN